MFPGYPQYRRSIFDFYGETEYHNNLESRPRKPVPRGYGTMRRLILLFFSLSACVGASTRIAFDSDITLTANSSQAIQINLYPVADGERFEIRGRLTIGPRQVHAIFDNEYLMPCLPWPWGSDPCTWGFIVTTKMSLSDGATELGRWETGASTRVETVGADSETGPADFTGSDTIDIGETFAGGTFDILPGPSVLFSGSGTRALTLRYDSSAIAQFNCSRQYLQNDGAVGHLRLEYVTELETDWNGDSITDMADLVACAGIWMSDSCDAPSWCDRCDLNLSGRVDFGDLAIFGSHWLRQPFTLPDGLIAHWSMDDNAAGKTVTDSGGGNHHGTAQRNTAAMATEGRLGGALGLDGTSDYIDCRTEAALLPEAWTVCAWVRCEDTATPTLISFGGTYPAVKLQQNGKGMPLIYLGPSNYRYFDAGAWTTLKDGQWHHAAFVMPGSAQGDITRTAMYLDGRAVAAGATMSSSPQVGKTRLLIGINATTGQQRFAGALDEVMLFNRALTAGEIQRIAALP
jgi:hypothetical protein